MGEGDRPASVNPVSGWDIAAAVGTIAAAVVAAVAAVFAAASARASYRIAKVEEARRSEERVDRQLADVVAALMRDGGSNWLRVVNYGPAPALEVSVTIEPQPRNLKLDEVPRELYPNQVVDLPYVRIPGIQVQTAEIEWTDGAGGHRRPIQPTPLTIHGGPPASVTLEEARRRLRHW